MQLNFINLNLDVIYYARSKNAIKFHIPKPRRNILRLVENQIKYDITKTDPYLTVLYLIKGLSRKL